MRDKALQKLSHELDLQRFVKRQKSHSLALFSLLNNSQKAFVNVFS